MKLTNYHAFSDVNNARENSYKQREKPSITEADEAYTPKSSSLVNNHSKSEEVSYRRQRSIENNGISQLESIAEEDRRKSLIQQLGEIDANDRLKIYIRGPSVVDAEQSSNKNRLSAKDSIKSPSSSYDKLANETASSTKVNNENHQIKSPISKNRSSHSKFNFDEDLSNTTTNNKLECNTSNTQYNRTSHKSLATTGTNRKEIDADNIETPPVARRVIASPTTTLVTVNNRTDSTPANHNESLETNNDLESTENPGYFDRYSMARRTRRYKRPTDYSSGNEDLTSTKDSSEENSLTQLAKNNTEIQKSQTKPEEKALPNTNVQENVADIKSKRTNISAKTITKLEKVGRHISSINQEDVQEALRNLKSPTDCPERLWSPPREIMAQRTANCNNNNNTTTTANGSTLIKISNHELNDEGFEETQSLVSDTPSHGKESTNSSCNEVNELPKLAQKVLSQKTTPIQKISSRLADRLQISRLRSSSSSSKSQPATNTSSSTRRSASSVDRSRGSRTTNGQVVQGPASSTAAAHMSNFTNNAIRRATTMRKTIGTSEPSSSSSGSTKRDVERCSSRNSLRSSRSSINSGTSTQTVKRMPLATSALNKSPLHTVSVDSSPSKRPLTTQNLRNNPSRGVPASRSSSSGSSVGPNIVVVRRLNSTTSNGPHQRQHTSSSSLASTSFKENQTNVMGSSRAQSGRSALMVKANVTNPQNTPRTVTTSSRSSSSSRGVSSFMRPTAASATKRTK